MTETDNQLINQQQSRGEEQWNDTRRTKLTAYRKQDTRRQATDDKGSGKTKDTGRPGHAGEYMTRTTVLVLACYIYILTTGWDVAVSRRWKIEEETEDIVSTHREDVGALDVGTARL